MTVVDNRPGESTVAEVLPLPVAGGPVRLPQLVGARRGWLMVVAPAAGIDQPLAGATIWDPAWPPGRHQLVLVTTPRPTGAEIAEALAAAGHAGAAALVVRNGCLPPDLDVTAAAARTGVPVLAVNEQVSWEEIGTLVRSLVSGARFGARGATPTASGLYELAESAALALSGAIVLTDADLRVLAFACRDTVDDLTSETILARRAPLSLRAQLGSARNRRNVAWIDVAGTGPRLVAPIRVGNVVVGYVLLAPGPDTPDSAPRVLGDVSAAAAAWFIDEQTGRDDEDAVRAELLRGLLAGEGSLAALTERLRRPTTKRWCLMSLGGHAKAPGVIPDIERLLARCARMLNPSAATAVLGSVAYVLFPSAPGSGSAEFAERVRQRAAVPAGSPLVACISRPLETSQDVRAECGLLRRAVDVLAARPEPVTAELAELRPHVLIAELAGLATEHPELLNGALDVLRYDESPRGAEYLDTLLSWFDAGCDATRAAAALRVHRNTFRYRLQRIEKLCAIDLDDAVHRFTLELQVRLLVLRGGW
ncbi:PucR family transcriptional regulator [Amycolatopsis taiwanensis]|uniref:PucR family transcriptional regulator n=1 Tax=Amycolatopsis taiwanensis TaxID=342230 RepID=UPI000483AC6B|nr:helix-turn-helix domain-containing protein [Amycolatopsis taiwanensis]